MLYRDARCGVIKVHTLAGEALLKQLPSAAHQSEVLVRDRFPWVARAECGDW